MCVCLQLENHSDSSNFPVLFETSIESPTVNDNDFEIVKKLGHTRNVKKSSSSANGEAKSILLCALLPFHRVKN